MHLSSLGPVSGITGSGAEVSEAPLSYGGDP